MENIADVLSNRIERIFQEKGLRPCLTPDGKIIVMDDDFTTRYKLDIAFNNSDFSCIVLGRRDNSLRDAKNFNVPWTSGKDIREFLEYLASMD